MSEAFADDAGSDREPTAIGWDAIDLALTNVYGERDPKHFGPILPLALGGEDPLDGISVYKNLEPVAHYHYVTYGFSELYDKQTDDPEYSGYGFELTFRLACRKDDPEDPPAWPLSLLQNFARYVFKTGNAFDERHHMSLNSPIALDEDTEITAAMLVLDPQLRQISTRNGQVKFLQIVGLCGDEYDLIQQGYFGPVCDQVLNVAPLAITDIVRSSILQDETVRAAITAREPGNSQRELFGTIAHWNQDPDGLTLRIAATIVPQFKNMLRASVVKGAAIAVYGNGTCIIFQQAEEVSWLEEQDRMTVSMPQEIANRLADVLQQSRGTYTAEATPNFRIEVVPVDITDRQGNVTATIG